MTRLRVGVIGAGRVGAVLAAALRAPATRSWPPPVSPTPRSGASPSCCPACRAASRPPSRADCDLLLLTVPDDMLPNVVAMLADSGALREGQYVVHTSGRHGLAVLEPARAVGARVVAMHPAMTFTGTRSTSTGSPGCVFGVTAGAAERAARRAARRRPRRHARCGCPRRGARSTTRASPTAPTTWSPWSPRRWRCSSAAGADDPAGTLRPLLTAALDNALEQGDAALTGPIVRGDVETVRAHLDDIAANAPQTLPSYVALARATLDRAVTDGRVLPIRAAPDPRRCSTPPWPAGTLARPVR